MEQTSAARAMWSGVIFGFIHASLVRLGRQSLQQMLRRRQ